MEFICFYCGEDASGNLELGRGDIKMYIPCCDECFTTVDSLPRKQKNKMAEAAYVAKMVGVNHSLHMTPFFKV